MAATCEIARLSPAPNRNILHIRLRFSTRWFLGGAPGGGMLRSRRIGCAWLAVIDSVCRIFRPKTPKLTVRGRWSRSRRFMYRRRESATWGFTGNAGRKSFKRSRKPLFAPRPALYRSFVRFRPEFPTRCSLGGCHARCTRGERRDQVALERAAVGRKARPRRGARARR